MSIRYLKKKDSLEFQTIRLEALSTDPEVFGETLAVAKKRSKKEWREVLGTLIQKDRKQIIVIEEAARPVGLCGFGITDEDETRGYFWGLYVSPDHRNKHYGQAMLQEAEKWIAAKGGESVVGRVTALNEGTKVFYRKCGYVVGPQCGTVRPDSPIPVYPIEKILNG